ncbi:hypothetical protein C8Q77DRAFT_1053686 [Trametes polyzona]|nr:hypothetical protein C8Q77DRAFT_1053686 [Trametes polyzona]
MLLEQQFSLSGKVALVTGANRGLALEGAIALVEAGARSVYCVDIVETPGPDWQKAREYVSRIRDARGSGVVFDYIRGDVSDQEAMWKIGKDIGDREGRMDVCFAAAGITGESLDSLYAPEESIQKVLDVNLKGSLFTAQSVGQQMDRFRNGGSIILVASVGGHLTNLGITSYEIAKCGVLQLARSLACELAPKGIRVNSISPGYHRTPMVDMLFKERPDWVQALTNRTALKRIAEPCELRGVIAWLASDASAFCTGSE